MLRLALQQRAALRRITLASGRLAPRPGIPSVARPLAPVARREYGGGGGPRPAHTSRHAGNHSTSPAPGAGIFVSEYFQLSPFEVQNFLQLHRMENSSVGEDVHVKHCIRCRTMRLSESNWSLTINKSNGKFFCSACRGGGSWYDFKSLTYGPSFSSTCVGGTGLGAGPTDPPSMTLDDIRISLEQSPEVIGWIQEQHHIHQDTLRQFDVGIFELVREPVESQDEAEVAATQTIPYLAFPWFSCTQKDSQSTSSGPGTLATGDLLRVKLVNIQDSKSFELDPRQGETALFGLPTVVSSPSKGLIITANEWDAMAATQETGLPAVALPLDYLSLPINSMPLLEHFSRIYLWFPSDVAGNEAADKFARKLGRDRCFVVRPPVREDGSRDTAEPCQPSTILQTYHSVDSGSRTLQPEEVARAMELLQVDMSSGAGPSAAGSQMLRRLLDAERIPHEQIQRFTALRTEIYNEFMQPARVLGVPSRTLPGLTRIIKGLRRGELTIVTGATGSGKTSFLSQLSLDYCVQGVSTLWGSFEIRNSRLAKKMISQYAGRGFDTDSLKDFDKWANMFERLPMHFLRFFGSTKVELVLDAMEHAVYVHDVEHIILDNLQFMMSGQGKGGYEKFDMQDKAIEQLRTFASEKNIHITVVIHPRKEDDNVPLMTSSVFGTAKATQEADNVIILQRNRRGRYLDVRKNRFDGELGTVGYVFDRPSQRFIQVEANTVLPGNSDEEASGSEAPMKPGPSAGARTALTNAGRPAVAAASAGKA
ncbi:hypothetical protein, variant [Fonticula alba]|uniref:SF4 helicase domain-containing protein n=1 Tax=Fonticula alba TaxID=691883 RepID=A0A058ZF19_FONAL|nr:hypothetical protein H696_00137 [Fonticula alba]XP_009492247.1 hypothetical protein, variant [Fonticula alba]KCV72545.1 hypothetical protein H696_00137 [Fonticula alba]KCV72546.1 hypothetical protein, variant [Fonticula alba]|eukprot:XP_009492246.1 hypothetical protein H696_00137 [Fonticula alba]